MKRLMIIAALTSAVSMSAFAGNIPTVGIAPPPPPDTVQTANTTAPGDIPSGGLTQQMTAAALALVQLMLRAVA